MKKVAIVATMFAILSVVMLVPEADARRGLFGLRPDRAVQNCDDGSCPVPKETAQEVTVRPEDSHKPWVTVFYGDDVKSHEVIGWFSQNKDLYRIYQSSRFKFIHKSKEAYKAYAGYYGSAMPVVVAQEPSTSNQSKVLYKKSGVGLTSASALASSLNAALVGSPVTFTAYSSGDPVEGTTLAPVSDELRSDDEMSGIEPDVLYGRLRPCPKPDPTPVDQPVDQPVVVAPVVNDTPSNPIEEGVGWGVFFALLVAGFLGVCFIKVLQIIRQDN